MRIAGSSVCAEICCVPAQTPAGSVKIVLAGTGNPSQTMPKTSPGSQGDAVPKVRCRYCKKLYKNARSLREHLRHHCKASGSPSRPRVFEQAKCRHCGKRFHSGNSLRVHVATQHRKEYARSPHSVKDHRVARKNSGDKVAGRNTQASPQPEGGRRSRDRQEISRDLSWKALARSVT